MPSKRNKRRPTGLRRDDILNLLKTQDRPRPFKFIAKQLDATGRGAQNKHQKELDRMVHDGQVTVNRRGDFGLVERMDLVRGRVIGHADGFGFLKPEDGGSDLYLPAKQMRRVLHGYFTPKSMEEWRPLVKSATKDLLDAAETRGEVDLMRDLAVPLPVLVIAEMMGVPESERGHIRMLAEKLLTIGRG